MMNIKFDDVKVNKEKKKNCQFTAFPEKASEILLLFEIFLARIWKFLYPFYKWIILARDYSFYIFSKLDL